MQDNVTRKRAALAFRSTEIASKDQKTFSLPLNCQVMLTIYKVLKNSKEILIFGNITSIPF